MADDFDDRFDDLFGVGYRAAFAVLGDRTAAEDCSSESLARALLRWPTIRGYAPAWVARVSTNLALDVAKRRRPPATAAEQTAGDDVVHLRHDMVRALRRLPARQRETVVLRYVLDLSEMEVAQAMGCSVGAVKSAASRGLDKLRASLGTDVEVT